MGLNAFFTYQLVLEQKLPWETALGVCFWTGAFFLILNLIDAQPYFSGHSR